MPKIIQQLKDLALGLFRFMINPKYLICLFIVVEISCAPATYIRRTVVVPTPRPPLFLGKPLDRGKLGISLGINPLIISIDDREFPLDIPSQPKAGDAGMFIPTMMLEGGFRFAPLSRIEFGVHVYYGNYHWADPSCAGVLPISEHGNADVYGITQGFQFNIFPSTSDFNLGISSDISINSIPQATFICPECKKYYCSGRDDCPYISQEQALEMYEFRSFTREIKYLMNFSLIFGRKIKIVYPFFVLSIQNAITNVGFDPRYYAESESTIKSTKIVGIVDTGVEILLKKFSVIPMVYYPINNGYADFSPGFSIFFEYKFSVIPFKNNISD